MSSLLFCCNHYTIDSTVSKEVMYLLIETIAKDDYRLEIHDDPDIQNPRTDYEPFGKMICWHRRYNLGDEHNFSSPDDFHISLLEAHVGDSEKAERMYDRICESAGREAERLGCERWRVVEQNVVKCVQDSHVILPLYLYDHSGISMSTGSFVGRAQHAEWDSGRVGVICAEKPEVEREYGAWNAETRRKAKDMLKSEVQQYDFYLRGEGYCFDLYKGDELIDSCGGFLGDLDDVKRDIAECLPEEMRGALVQPEHPKRSARASGMAM